MTLGLVCDACDALSPLQAAACVRCGSPLVDAAAARSTPEGMPDVAETVPSAPARVPADAAPTTVPPLVHSGRLCANCGAEVPANHRFCGECGARLDLAPGASPVSGHTQVFNPMMQAGRARLILIKGDGLDSISYHLAGTEHVVGRTEGEILFADDTLVSPRHANFFYRGIDLYVRDEDSRNGVFLRVTKPVRIAVNQPFLVGEQLLLVQPANVEGLSAADAEGTYYYGSPRRPARIRVLQVLAGGDAGMALRVPSETLTIGREGNHVNFPDDPFISGRHAQVTPLEDGGFRLADVGSKNGTFVRMQGETRLEHGDYVFLGQQLLRVEIM